MNLKETCRQQKVVPVIIISDYEDTMPLCEALYNGGLKSIEITLRTKDALKSVETAAKKLPKDACIGVGTIKNKQQLIDSKNAGAQFAVSPGSTEKILVGAKEVGIPLLPGTITPSEILQAYELGYDFVKFFPAELFGGAKVIKGYSSPLSEISFCPTGGVNLNNIDDYLSAKNIVCVGGTWIASDDLVKAKNWKAIEENAKKAFELTRKYV